MLNIVDIIYKEFNEVNKRVIAKDNKLMATLNEEQKIMLQNIYLLSDYEQGGREKELISFVLDFVTSIWSKRTNRRYIIFD